MKEKILKVMDDLMQRNCICNYVIEQNGEETYLKNIKTLDAYMKAFDMSKNGNVKCYMAVLGKENKAVRPIFTIINGVVKLSELVIR